MTWLDDARKKKCPICKKDDLWINNIPYTLYCWGTEKNPHSEWSKKLSVFDFIDVEAVKE